MQKWDHRISSILQTFESWSDKVRIRKSQLKQLPWAVLSILVAVAVIFTGWSVFLTRDWSGLALNFGTEIAGAIVTYLLLEIVIGTRQRKESLIAQLMSRSADVATRAIEELVRNNWHRDGSLNNIRLYRANLQNAELDLASFENSDLTEANLEGASLYRANLQGAILQRVNLTRASVGFANLSNADLTNATLTEADLFHSSLVGASMSQANLQGTALQKADLQGAFLYAADLRGAKLDDANLQQAHLREARYDSQTIFPTNFNPSEAGMVSVHLPLF